MTITRRYLHFPVRHGAPVRRVTLRINGGETHGFDLELDELQPDFHPCVDLQDWLGQAVEVLVDGQPATGTVQSHCQQSDTPLDGQDLYHERHRPQFHFSARRGWINDPNGLVWQDGVWHLFFQHNPYGIGWGNMHWGHATSPDLLHWTEGPIALYPDALGTMFSGSAVVDHANTAGLQAGAQPTLALLYTAAGQPFTQCLATSTDGGQTFTKYAGNPVVPNLHGSNRDPKVIWHEPTQRWIMALYVPEPVTNCDGSTEEQHTIVFLASDDLVTWTRLSQLAGFYECPDLFPLPVDGDPSQVKWVVYGGNLHYATGVFDGTTFTPDGPQRPGDYGAAPYAAQTFSDTPDGRRILISWLRGQYPGMPFCHQMSFPVELTLRHGPDGLRLCRYPVAEIRQLSTREHTWSDLTLAPGAPNPLAEIRGELFDLELVIEPGQAEQIVLTLRGHELTWQANEELSCLGRTAWLPPADGQLRLRVLVDRTTIEVFGQEGWVGLTSCCLFDEGQLGLALRVEGGEASVTQIVVRELASAWA